MITVTAVERGADTGKSAGAHGRTNRSALPLLQMYGSAPAQATRKNQAAKQNADRFQSRRPDRPQLPG